MREIKFRGKRIDNGEWVYGYLIEFWTPKGQKQKYAIDTCQTYAWEGDSIDVFEIIPETVGQYTGLKDKNGKEIYEGDVLQKQGFWSWYVAFEDFAFVTVPCLRVQAVNWKHNRLSEELTDGWKIIGNRFDNPELLEASQ